MMAAPILFFGHGLWSMPAPKLHKMVMCGPELLEGGNQNCVRTVTAQESEFHGLSLGSDSI